MTQENKTKSTFIPITTIVKASKKLQKEIENELEEPDPVLRPEVSEVKETK